jgi:Cu+-exporting ATPase
MSKTTTVELPIAGMDCAECTRNVHKAIAGLPGVESVNVFLTSEKAVVQLNPALVGLPALRQAVAGAGYTVRETAAMPTPAANPFARQVITLFAVLFGVILFVIVVGEWLGLFEQLTRSVPFPIGLLIVVIAGWPIFRNVGRAALKGQVISHTLMTLGVIAALAVGQWATATVIVFFMRVGEYAESFTAERARRAVKNLAALAPQTARIEQDGREQELPIKQVQSGQVVIVRPGEKIPVDGEVIGGQATVNEATLTGEAMPVEVGPGSNVLAATIISLGSIRVRTTHVGPDTTFGRVVRMVEEAEAHRADVQRIADKFSAYYLPVVAAVAALTFLIRRDPLATAAVLVVACSCSFALATPIAMLASVGAAAQRGLLIKGGKYLELLAQSTVLLIDKTGTVTLGRPQVADVVALNGVGEGELLAAAASVERYSEHPLAQAVREMAYERGLALSEPERFEALPGMGVRAELDGRSWQVGSRRLLGQGALPAVAAEWEGQGKTLLFVAQEGELVGILAATDRLRPEVPQAIQALRALGLKQIELLTGDQERTAAALAGALGIPYRAGLMPADKIAIVKQYQAQGHKVVMVGDGVNDAPALAQADVGIAMGAAGSDVAIEAAHIALLREDWSLVPDLFRIARRTMRVVKFNIGFTVLYNVIGLSLAAFGILPPILAAAAQSFPDLGILANSSRLLRYRK